jgi:integrase/recombinase XerD
MTFTKAMREFLEDLRLGKAKNTVTAYESDLGQLLAFIRPNSVTAFTPEAIRAFLAEGKRQGNSPSTLKRKRVSCQGLGKFGLVRGFWPTNPVDQVSKITRPKTPPRPYDAAELQKFVGLAPSLPTVERLLLALLLYTGLRISPICNLRVGDISLSPPPVLRAVVKGGKTQVVSINEGLLPVLESYILNHTTLAPQEFLFKNRHGGPWRIQRAEEVTRAWGKALGIVKCTPHRFRHSVATQLLRLGADTRRIQTVMGHESLATTQQYLEVAAMEDAETISRLRWGI